MTTKVTGVWCRVGLSPRGPHQWRDKPGPIRCNGCGRRMLASAVYEFGFPDDDDHGIVGYRVPPHKTKSRMLQRPKGDRGGRLARRG